MKTKRFGNVITAILLLLPYQVYAASQAYYIYQNDDKDLYCIARTDPDGRKNLGFFTAYNGLQSMWDSNEENTVLWKMTQSRILSGFFPVVEQPLPWRNNMLADGYSTFVTQKITIGGRIVNVGAWCFAHMRDVTVVDMWGTTSIDYDAGHDPRVEKIGNGAFAYCFALEAIEHFENNPVRTIGDDAFRECKKLGWVNMAGSMQEIGERAFKDCTGLNDITCYAGNPPTVYNSTFEGVDLSRVRLQVHAGSLEAYTKHPVWSQFGYFRAYGEGDVRWPIPRNINLAGPESVAPNEQIRLTAAVTPENARGKDITWSSSDNSIATVDNDGTVSGLKEGSVDITARTRYGRAEQTKTIRIVRRKVERVTVNNSSPSIIIGKKFTLTATVYPDNATDLSITWDIIGSTTANGIETVYDGHQCTITAKQEGVYAIRITAADGKTCDVSVTVRPEPVTSIRLDKTDLTVHAGEYLTLNATVLPEDATYRSVTWENSNTAVATIKTTGVSCTVRTHGAGTAGIRAYSHGREKFADCQISVLPLQINSIELNSRTVTLNRRDTLRLTAAVQPENAVYVYEAIKWTTDNPDLLKITPDGLSCTVSVKEGDVPWDFNNDEGRAAVRAVSANSESMSDVCEITVKQTRVSEVKLSANTFNVRIDSTLTVTATVLPEDARNKLLSWTSDNSEAVELKPDNSNNSCEIKPKETGTAIITVKSNDFGNKQAQFTVNVKPIPIDTLTVTMTGNSDRIIAGDSVILTASISPANATCRTVRWDTDDAGKEVVDLKPVGLSATVTAKNPGAAAVTVTATDGSGKAAVSIIRVDSVRIESVRLNADSLFGTAISNIMLTATVLPNNATDKSLSWHTDDESVIRLATDGLSCTAIPVKPGKAHVSATAKYGAKTDTVVITIDSIWVSSVAINMKEVSLTEKNSIVLRATVLPEYATDRSVVWHTDSTQTVDLIPDGLSCRVIAKKEGRAAVTATAVDGKAQKDMCAVTVNPVYLREIRIDRTEIDLTAGSGMVLNVTIIPEDAKREAIIWQAEDPSIVDLAPDDLSCTVIALKAGKTFLRAVTEDGWHTSTGTVTVTPVEVQSIVTEKEIHTTIGKSIVLTATVLPENTADKSVSWTNSNTSVVSIGADGLSCTVIPLAAGEATVTAVAGNGISSSSRIYVAMNTSISRAAKQSMSVEFNRAESSLYINSGTDEFITVYNLCGIMLYKGYKSAGQVIIKMNTQENILIVKGSSGGGRKLIIKN